MSLTVLDVSAKAAPIAKIFDPVKLEAMQEPLAVRVEKIKGSTRTPIPLPAGEDGSAQGSNFSKEDVRGLEAWLVTEWAGGGMYSITVTDSSMPAPMKHDWTIYYNPQTHPEKTPPTLMAPVQQPVAADNQPSQPQQVRSMAFPPAFPNGFPQQVQQPQAQPGQPQQFYQQPPAWWQFPQAPAPRTELPLAGSSAAAAAADAERRRLEDQVRAMNEQLARAREEQLQAQHRQELERVRAEQAAAIDGLKQTIAGLATTANARPAVDPAFQAQIEALKEQNRILAQAAENEKREREAERREREIKDMIARQADDSRRQAEEARRAQEQMQASFAAQLAAMTAANANKGPDPMIMFLQENARQQVESAREQARNQLAQMTAMQSFMMKPGEIMAMAKESSSGVDSATRSLTNTYQDIFQMQRAAIEQIVALQGNGGSETIALIEKGMERASSFAERFIGGKTKEAVTAQQSQAQMAQAQAAAMQAQAAALQAQARMQATAAQQQQQQPDNGLNGIAAVAGPAGDTRVAQTSTVQPAGQVITPPADSWTTGPVLPSQPPSTVKKVLGRTDAEWFGPILPQVEELRKNVATFMHSIAQKPPTIKDRKSVV